MNSHVIRLTGLRKEYGKVVALEAIDLSVPAGEFLTLLGPSGSGKTTLLNLIAGTIPPTSGQILIHDRDVTHLPSSKRGLGMVFQHYALFPHMNIYDNVAFPLRVRRVPESEIRGRVARVLELVHLPHVAKRKPKELSGGQQQRISIARCLVYDPPLILMDEPLGALDKKLRSQMQLEIKRIADLLDITVLYVTHDQEEALTMSDRICVMGSGRIAQIGSPSDVYFRPNSQYVADFLGEPNFIPAIVKDVGNAARLLGPADVVIEVSAPSAFPLDSPVCVMVRPESMQVSHCVAGAVNSFPGTVTDVIFEGGTTNVIVQTASDLCLRARGLTGAGQAVRPGEAVIVSFRPDTARVFPRDG